MDRRGFLKLLGAGAAGAAVTAAGLAVPDVARRFFLPPAGGWHDDYRLGDHIFGLDEFEKRILEPAMQRVAANLDEEMTRTLQASGLNVGDVVTFGDVYNEQRTHLKQFIVTSVGDSRRVIAQLEPFHYKGASAWV
jgi:hypothetical protein